jgi:predicted acylesterase/phospholipase RssA/CRP-like cAMP-binding protein
MADDDPRSAAHDAMARSSFFRGLREAVREALASQARRARFGAGELLLGEGVVHGELVLVAGGLVHASTSVGGVEEVIEQAGAGALLGASALDGKPERASWIADLEVAGFAWDRAVVLALDEEFPDVSLDLSTALSVRERTRELVTSIHHASPFRQTSPVLIAELVRRSTLLRAPSGRVLFRQGEPGDAFYVVVRGEIEIARESGDAGPETLATLYSGDALGEMALLTDAPRNATARAVRDSELLLVTRRDFDDLLEASTAFQRGLRGVLEERSRGATPRARRTELWWFVNRTEYPLAALLAHLAQAMGDLGDRVAEVHFASRRQASRPDAVPRGLVVVETTGDIEAAVDRLTGSGDVDYLLCSVAPELETQASAALAHRARRTVVFTEDASQRAPAVLARQDALSWVEVRAPGWSRAPVPRFRRGTIPMRLPAGPAELSGAARPAPGVSDEFARLARALTDRTVGVALGGGAAWGFAHVALIRRMREAGIPIDMITGTSVGSMVGALYASRGLDGLDAFVGARRQIQVRAAACIVTSRPVIGLLSSMLEHARLEDLPIPFFPVAVDIDAGRERLFRHGSIAEAVRASCSLPGVFGPSDYEGRRYVDGCVMCNVPVDALIEEGADFVVASNIIPTPAPFRASRSRSPWGRAVSEVSFTGRVRDALRALFLLYNVTGERQAVAADVTFSPDLNPHLPTDFLGAREIILRAEEQLGPVIAEVQEKFAAFCRRSAAR